MVIKKYLDHKFSINKKLLKDTPDFYYFKLLYIGNLLRHIKNKISKICKEFCKENFNNQFIIIFHIKTQLLMIWNLSYYINLLVPPVVLAAFAKLAVILKVGLRNISKSIY